MCAHPNSDVELLLRCNFISTATTATACRRIVGISNGRKFYMNSGEEGVICEWPGNFPRPEIALFVAVDAATWIYSAACGFYNLLGKLKEGDGGGGELFQRVILKEVQIRTYTRVKRTNKYVANNLTAFVLIFIYMLIVRIARFRL